jgi:hypothetical protein
MLKRSAIMAEIHYAIIYIIVQSLYSYGLFVSYPLSITVPKFVYIRLNSSIGSRTVAFAYHGDNNTLRVMWDVGGGVSVQRCHKHSQHHLKYSLQMQINPMALSPSHACF